jgi:hypothetical protein
MLRGQKTKDWRNVVTLDASWFYYIAYHEFTLHPHGGKVPDLARLTIQPNKVMLTIALDQTGFASVTALDSGCKFNADYYVSKVLTPLSEWWCERGGGNFEN